MIKKYSLREHGREHELSQHFTLGEFACKDGTDEVFVSEQLVILLEEIRAWCKLHVTNDARIIITSGYRTEKYNERVGGEKHSFHKRGMAADFKVIGFGNAPIDPYVIYHAINDGKVTDDFKGGLGLYPSWVHVDVRGNTARWNKS